MITSLKIIFSNLFALLFATPEGPLIEATED